VVELLVAHLVALNALEGLHPLVHVDDPVAADVDEVEDVLDDREAGDWVAGQLTKSDDEFIKLIERHLPAVILIKLPRVNIKQERAYLEESVLWGQQVRVYVVLYGPQLLDASLDD